MRTYKRDSGEFNSASMADIAFLLLIFLLVTTIFAVEKGIPMLLPPEDVPVHKIKRSNVLTVQALANGTIILEGRQVALPNVRTVVERHLASNDQLVVVIESHPDSEYGLMVDIFDELRLANARRISLKQMTTDRL